MNSQRQVQEILKGNIRRGGFASTVRLACAVVFLLPLLAIASLPAAEQKDELWLLENHIRRLFQKSLKNYRGELDAMKKYYLDHCGPLPSEAELFFSSLQHIPEPEPFILTVKRDVSIATVPTESLPTYPGCRNLISGAGLAYGSGPFAADDATADLLGLPRSTSFRVGCTWAPFQEYERFEVYGNIAWGYGYWRFHSWAPRKFDPGTTAERYDQRSGDPRSWFPVSVKVPPGLSLDSDGTRLYVVAPGVHKVEATLQGSYIKGYHRRSWVRREMIDGEMRDVNNQLSEPVVGDHTVVGGEIRGLQATRLGLMGVDVGPEDESVRWDVFRTSEYEPESLSFKLGAVVQGHPDHSYFGLGLKSKLKATVVEGNTFRGVIAGYNPAWNHPWGYWDDRPANHWGDKWITEVKATALPAHGRTKFRLELSPVGGGRLESDIYTLTNNSVRMEISPEPAMNRLAAGEEYDVKVLVEGGADMSRYECAWELLTAGGEPWDPKAAGMTIAGDWGREAVFSKQSDLLWVARTRLWVDPASVVPTLHDLREPWKRSVTRIIPHARAEHAFRVRGPTLTICPAPLSRLSLSARRPGQDLQPAPATFDFFSPNPRIGNALELLVTLEFKNGTVFRDVPAGDLYWVAIQQEGGELLKRAAWAVWRPKGRGFDGVGATRVRAVVTPMAALNAGLLLDNPDEALVSEPVRVTMNHLVLESHSDRQAETKDFRLTVFGPADMAPYRAKWDLQIIHPASTKATLTKNFVKEGGQFMSDAHAPLIPKSRLPGGYLEKVSLLDKSGTAIVEILAEDRVELSPTITLDAPKQAFLDREILLTAQIDDVPEDLLARSYCQWHVDSGIGRFKSAKTRIEIEKLWRGRVQGARGRSRAVLVLNPNRANVGKSPEVRVELYVGEAP